MSKALLAHEELDAQGADGVVRIRRVMPAFFRSRRVGKLSWSARLTLIGLWTVCDDEGRCVADVRIINSEVWPIDNRPDDDVRADLAELVQAGLIAHYTACGESYLSVHNWAREQRVPKPTPSTIPDPATGTITPLTCTNTVPEVIPTNQVEISGSPTGIGEQNGRATRARVTRAPAPAPPRARVTKTTTTNTKRLPTAATRRLGRARADPHPREALPGTDVASTPAPTESAAQIVVAAYIDGATDAGKSKPSNRLCGIVGKEAQQLHDKEHIPVDALVVAAHSMGGHGWHKLDIELQRIATEVVRDNVTETGDGRVLSWLSLAEKYAKEDAEK